MSSSIILFGCFLGWSNNLSAAHKQAAYLYDSIVVVVLETDYYMMMKKSKQGLEFILSRSYEIVSILPLCICYN